MKNNKKTNKKFIGFFYSKTYMSFLFSSSQSYVNFFSSIGSFGIPSMVISAICVTILLVVKIQINERYKHKIPVPFPTEIIIVLHYTIYNHFCYPINFDFTISHEFDSFSRWSSELSFRISATCRRPIMWARSVPFQQGIYLCQNHFLCSRNYVKCGDDKHEINCH